MDDSFGPEVEAVVRAVREELEAFREWHARHGLKVEATEVEAHLPFPTLLVYVTHDQVAGERVVPYSLELGGRLIAPGDAAQSLAFAILEASAADVRRWPLSERKQDSR